jgi:hypothetical protein
MVTFPNFRLVASCLVLASMLGCSLITNVDRNDIDEGAGGSSGENGTAGTTADAGSSGQAAE